MGASVGGAQGFACRGVGARGSPGQEPMWAPSGGDSTPGAVQPAPMPGFAGNEAEEPIAGALRRPGERLASAGWAPRRPDPGMLRLDVWTGRSIGWRVALPAPGRRSAESRFADRCVGRGGRAAGAS